LSTSSSTAVTADNGLFASILGLWARVPTRAGAAPSRQGVLADQCSGQGRSLAPCARPAATVAETRRLRRLGEAVDELLDKVGG
jgi:hypothetical protein